MGRTDEVRVILEVNAEMRRLLPRLTIDAVSGWETRGNGLSGDYEGGIVHHTAFKSSATNIWPAKSTLLYGRPDLSGPLCNYSGPWCTEEAPRIAVVAAFPANHAGASGGRSMGPLPVTTNFNKRVLGLEIDYAGLTPMTDGQMLVAEVWAKAVARVVGSGNIERVRAHMETSITGKWDPGYASGRTISMADFRKRAAARTAASTPTPTPTPTPEEPDLDANEHQMLQAVYDRLTKPEINGGTLPAAVRSMHNVLILEKHDSLALDGASYNLVDFVRYIDRHVRELNRDKVPALQALLTTMAAASDVDEKALATALAPLLRPMMTEMVTAARTSDVTADALVDEFLERAVAGSPPQAAAG